MNSFAIFSSPPFFEALDYASLPDGFAEIVQAVLVSKAPQVVSCDQGKFLVEWSSTGPFGEVVDGWLPIKVSCLQKWKSGGVKMNEFQKQVALEQLGNLLKKLPKEQNWDGYGAEPPNDVALHKAEEVIDLCVDRSLFPTNVTACADGGVSIGFVRTSLAALIECFNDGKMTVGMSRGKDQTNVHEVEDVQEAAALIEASLKKSPGSSPEETQGLGADKTRSV